MIYKTRSSYRKILVIAEDDGEIRPKTIEELFSDVPKYSFFKLHSLFIF